MLATEEPTAQTETESVDNEDHSNKDQAGEEGKKDILFEVDQIIVNPASTVGSRFLSCSVAFELEDEACLKRFKACEIKIRDALITVLSARTVDELADTRLRQVLRRQILTKVNKLTEPAKAKAIYFKDFVLQ